MDCTGTAGQYSLKYRADRLNSSGRVVLAVFFQLTIWLDPSDPVRYAHAIDLLSCAALMALSDGPSRPFFVYFAFLLIAAMVRWQWPGTLGIALAAISVVLVMAWYLRNFFLDPYFELNPFCPRGGRRSWAIWGPMSLACAVVWRVWWRAFPVSASCPSVFPWWARARRLWPPPQHLRQAAA